MMDFFRRPSLVGKNLVRTSNGKVRGSIRRADPDGTSAVPYFTGVSATQTLLITTQGGSVTATLSGIGLNTILADINTAVGVNAKAYSDDGCIAIESTVLGSGGFVRITGGTASSKLGFETYGGTRNIEGRGSDIPSSPEARLGNPFGVALPGKGENITVGTFTRALGRISANADVLWSDHVKNSLSYKNVSFSVSADGKYIIPDSTQRLVTVGGLTAASTVKDLIPYYQLIDTTTGLASASQVVAVVRGVPAGDPPYANSPSWADTTGKNVLGQDQTKVNALAITAISEGRYVSCTGATFITTGVVVGDFAEISGATNIDQWSNNGYRWVVESVLSETVLTLRPMAKAELAAVGTSPTDTQPIVELNDILGGGGQVYGNLTVRTGVSAHNVILVTRPPIPSGAVYELRAAVPSSLRDDLINDKQMTLSSALLDITAPQTPIHNGTLSGLVASISGNSCVLTSGKIRWRGRFYAIPGKTFLPADLVNGTNYIYWDDADTTLKATTSLSNVISLYDPSVGINKGHLLARVVMAAGTITNVIPISRLIADAARPITVGAGAQFNNLNDAIRYISDFATGWTETTSSSGTYPHFEIVVVSDTTYSGALISVPHLTIRGVTPATKVTISSGGFLLGAANSTLQMRDLTIVKSSGVSDFITSTAQVSTIRLFNITNIGGNQSSVFSGTNSPDTVTIDSCNFKLTTNIVVGAPQAGKGNFTLTNTTFTYDGNATPQLFKNSADANWGGTRLLISNCLFDGGWITTSTNPLCVSATSATSDVIIENSIFTLGTHNNASNKVFITASTGRAILKKTRITGGIPIILNGNVNSTIEECYAEINGIASIGITAGSIINNELVQLDVAGAIGAAAALVKRNAVGNYVHGPFLEAFTSSDNNINLSSNYIDLAPGATAIPSQAILVANGNNVNIENNIINISVAGVEAMSGIVMSGTTNDVLVCNNNIHTTRGTGAALNISSGTHTDYTISGNKLINTLGSTGAIGLNATVVTNASISNNDIIMKNGGFAIITDVGSTNLTFVGNLISAGTADPVFDGAYKCNTANLAYKFEGNTFIGRVQFLSGIVEGNSFAHSVGCNSANFSNNTFSSSVTVGTAATNFTFINNTLTSNLDASLAAPNLTEAWIMDNSITGTCTIVHSHSGANIYVLNNSIAGNTFTVKHNTTDNLTNYVQVYGNYFSNSALTFNAKGVRTCVENNYFNNSGSSSYTVIGDRAEVVGNFINSTNLSTVLVVDSFGNGTFRVEENIIYAKTQLGAAGTGTIIDSLRFIANVVIYNGSDHAVTINCVPSTGTVFSENNIFLGQGGRTDEAKSCVFTTALNNAIFSNNLFGLTSSAYSGAPPTFTVGLVASASVWNTVSFVGNQFQKPANLGAPARNYDYIRNTNAGTIRVMLTGNLGMNPTNVGAAPREGGFQAATNVAAAYNLPE
jgi:hypothetical protein